jgi:alpha-glucosidase
LPEIHSQGQNWALTLDGRAVIDHSPERPFAFAVVREKRRVLSRGSARVRETLLRRVPLWAVSAERDGAVFSGDGFRLTLRLEPRPDGFFAALSWEGEGGCELRFPARPGEPVFGGGEQYRRLDLAGLRVPNFVSEHITLPTVLKKAALPAALCPAVPAGKIGSYAPMPVFVSGGKRLLAFETDSDGTSEFGEDAWVFSFDRCPSGFTCLAAESFRALGEALARERPNRQYLPDWCLNGMILGVQGGADTVLRKAFAMQDAGAAVCGVWCQDWCGEKLTAAGKQVCWNWEADPALYPDLRETIARLGERGIRFLAYLNPYLVKDGPQYRTCRERGFLITRRNGEVYHMKSTTFEAGMLDLTNPAAADYIRQTLIRDNMLSLGVKGWMADFGEYLPTDCVLHDGDPEALHNRWPVLWAKLNREAAEAWEDPEVFFFTRSGYLGVQNWAPVMWNGDQHVDWSRDYGMPCVMPASFSLGFSGVTLVHSDIGGFFSMGRMRRSGELFVRWMEMNAFTPLMRSHESLRPAKNAQFDTALTGPYTVALSRLHAALRPYFSAVAAQAAAGVPAMRPDFYESGDYADHADEYAFFLGDDLFVAPVIRPGVKKRRVCLPAGKWVHFFTGKRYFGGRHTVDAPLGTPAVFYRSGSRYAPLFASAAAEYRKGR